MRQQRIHLTDYLQESPGDKDARDLGPYVPDGDTDEDGNVLRIPHSGFVYKGVTYILIGWKASISRQRFAIPASVEKEIVALFGRGVMLWNEERKSNLARLLQKGIGWARIKKEFAECRKKQLDNGDRIGVVQAFDLALRSVEENGSVEDKFNIV